MVERDVSLNDRALEAAFGTYDRVTRRENNGNVINPNTAMAEAIAEYLRHDEVKRCEISAPNIDLNRLHNEAWWDAYREADNPGVEWSAAASSAIEHSFSALVPYLATPKREIGNQEDK